MSWDAETEEKKNKKKAKKFERQRMADMKDVLATDQGKNVLWEILEMTKLMGKVPGNDALYLARCEGSRDVGVGIHDWIMQASPKEFLNMLQIRAKAFNEFEEEEDDASEEKEDD